MHFNVYKIQLNEDSEQITLNPTEDEFVEMKWVDPSELSNIKLTPPSIELFTKLGFLN